MPSIALANNSSDSKDKKEKKMKKKIALETSEPQDEIFSDKKQKKKDKKKRKAMEIDSEDEERSETSSELVEPVNLKSEKTKKNKKAKLAEEDDEGEGEVAKAEDPNAISRFRISGPLREKLKSKGIESLFPIQARTFDDILDGSDLVGRARTGQVLFCVLFVLSCAIYFTLSFSLWNQM